jgi:hypothetical protein
MNVMVDLETLGTTPNSSIVSIGAVKFSSAGVGDEFYQTINLQSCKDAGLDIDPSTVAWWMGQSNEARAVFNSKGKDLPDVLEAFTKFIGIENVGNVKVWGNGANFDNVILVNAYRRTGIKAPWQFYNDRCYRTIKSMFKKIEMERTGTHHNALDDAKSQAEHLVRILNVIGGRHS